MLLLKRICNTTNIRYRSMHKLRKTYASYLLANGVEEKIAQAQLRHKDSTTTHKYYEFSIRSREYKKEVLNKNDMLQKRNINVKSVIIIFGNKKLETLINKGFQQFYEKLLTGIEPVTSTLPRCLIDFYESMKNLRKLGKSRVSEIGVLLICPIFFGLNQGQWG